jgi:RHS repeat-associated protein
MFVYKDGHIDHVITSEGRMKRNQNGSYYPEYFLKDHLGNVRMMHSPSSGLSQATDYYPFGMEIPVYGVNDNQIKYNSKELQTDAKLDWYDYGARFYDPVIGKWHAVDPLAETSRRWSPYTYCMNNPIRFIDPDGMETRYPPFIGPTNPLRIASGLYNNLPSDVTRTIGATWNMVSGGAQFLGGAAFATVTCPTVAGEVVGGLVAMHGAYKFAEGVHQLANVASGTNANEDPQYVTPEGSITESKVVDHAVDLAVGLPTGNVNTTVVLINTISTPNQCNCCDRRC